MRETAQIIRLHKQELPFVCSACGADRGCKCNAPAIEKAAAALARSPKRSDRAIAKELGIGSNTVRRARQATAPDGAVGKRVGLDGKIRRMPKRNQRSVDVDQRDYSDLPEDFRPIQPEGVKLVNRAVAISVDYGRAVHDFISRGNIDQHTREVLSRSIHQCANELSVLAQELMGMTHD